MLGKTEEEWAMAWPWQKEEKSAQVSGSLVALANLATPRWGARSPAALIRDGYLGNAVAYRCVRMIAEAAASIPLETENRDLAALLAAPAPDMDGQTLLEHLYANLQISGNAFAEAVSLTADDVPGAIFVLLPDRMKPVAGYNGWVEGWTYEAGRTKRTINRTGDGWLPVLHVKLFNPGDDTMGLAPLSPARKALDLHNSGADWQKALLDNSARPSGALVYGKDGARMTDEQFDRLKTELDGQHTGALNAGRPLLLEGGLDWKPMSLSPADMDFLDARHAASREIALAFGVPPMLLGIPGDNTYSNYREANSALWKSTVLPLAERMAKALTSWIGHRFGSDAVLRCRTDQVAALAPERVELWANLDRVGFLTDDEKRQVAGFAPADGGR
ncbi:MAG: phage portal protein [Pseudomonadota bacterium]